MTSKRRLKTNQ